MDAKQKSDTLEVPLHEHLHDVINLQVESQKLMQKYPGLTKNPSALLQRRLSKNVSYPLNLFFNIFYQFLLCNPNV